MKTLLPIFFQHSFITSLGLFVFFFSIHTLHRFSPNSLYFLVLNQQPFLMEIKRPSVPYHCQGRASTLFVPQSFSLSTIDIWSQKTLCCACFSGQSRVVRTSTHPIQKLHWCDNQKISSRCLLGSKITPQKKPLIEWQPTPAFLPGESQGQRSLVGCRLWGRTESDTTEATQQQQQQQSMIFLGSLVNIPGFQRNSFTLIDCNSDNSSLL